MITISPFFYLLAPFTRLISRVLEKLELSRVNVLLIILTSKLIWALSQGYFGIHLGIYRLFLGIPTLGAGYILTRLEDNLRDIYANLLFPVLAIIFFTFYFPGAFYYGLTHWGIIILSGLVRNYIDNKTLHNFLLSLQVAYSAHYLGTLCYIITGLGSLTLWQSLYIPVFFERLKIALLISLFSQVDCIEIINRYTPPQVRL